MLGVLVKALQGWITGLIGALKLADHQLRVTYHRDLGGTTFPGRPEAPEKSVVLSNIVGVGGEVSEPYAAHADHVRGLGAIGFHSKPVEGKPSA